MMGREKMVNRPTLLGFAAVMAATACLTWVPQTWAQEVNATIVGTVKDASGGVIPNARVAVTDVQTGVAHETTINSTGNYSVGQLIPGTYMVAAEYKGFKKEVITGIVLEVNQTARVDI